MEGSPMHQRNRRQRYLLNFFDRQTRAERDLRREIVQDARLVQDAELVQEVERQAAVRRILEQSTRPLPVLPPRNTAPLLTPGQAFRSMRPEQ